MSKNHHPDAHAPRDPERRNLLVASAALAALGGNSLASTALQDEGGNNGEPAANPITPDLIAHAEKLAGIEFTPEERETIANTKEAKERLLDYLSRVIACGIVVLDAKIDQLQIRKAAARAALYR